MLIQVVPSDHLGITIGWCLSELPLTAPLLTRSVEAVTEWNRKGGLWRSNYNQT